MADQPNAAQSASTVFEGLDAIERLRQLDVDPTDLAAALDAGESAAAQPDDAHPVTASGAYRWFETVAVLRKRLVTRGWVASDPRNSPRVTNAQTGIAIVPVSGNGRTGLAGLGDPQTARPRGETTARATGVNVQLELDLGLPLVDRAGDRERDIRTWMLLYRPDEQRNELRAELSLPILMDVRGFVSTWHERILLEPRRFEIGAALPRDAKGGGDVDFTIEAV